MKIPQLFLEGEKKNLFPHFYKCIKKSKCPQEKIWNLVLCRYLVSAYPTDRTLEEFFLGFKLQEKSSVLGKIFS